MIELWTKLLPSENNNIFWISEVLDPKYLKASTWNKAKIFSFITPKFLKKISFGLATFIIKFYKTLILLQNEKIDIIQVRNGIYESLIAVFFKHIYSIPFSFHLSSTHAFDDEPLLRKYDSGLSFTLKLIRVKCKILLYSYIIRQSDIFSPISYPMGSRLAKLGVKNYGTLMPIGLCSSNTYLNIKRKKSSSDNVNIVFSGSIGFREEFLMKIFKNVSKNFDNVSFTIIGLLSNRMLSQKQVENLAVKYGLESKIKFFFNVNYKTVPTILSKCDIGISAIPPDQKYIVSSPSKLVDYMALGIPVIGNSEIIEQNRIITESDCGLLVEYGHEQFSEGICEMIKNMDLFLDKGRKGKFWISKNQNFTKLSSMLSDEYKKLLAVNS